MNSAALVAAGILASRLSGFIRLRAFAHYFGLQSDAADAFNAAFRIPNLLQNLFGEGALSASFIPAYARLLAEGDRETADRLAGAVAGLLALTVSAIVLAGVMTAPVLARVLAPGFTGEKQALTVAVIRILFPGAGLLVLSAWCLGVLNSHRRFLLSYAAPVVWNAAMIATLVTFGPGVDSSRLAVLLAWGSVAGSALQVLAQAPVLLRVAPAIRVSVSVSRHVREVGRSFLPAFLSRGVVQISAFIDTVIATLLPTGAVTGLANAQLIYLLPVSLFGMSVAAAELPAMSSGGAEALRDRLDAGLRRISFFVVPSAVAFIAYGDLIAGALLQTGRFDASDADYVWGILAGSAVGLVAATRGRLYSSAYYAVRDTAMPLRCALIRVACGTVMGYAIATHGPALVGLEAKWGAAGLTAASGIAAWIEMHLLRAGLNVRIGSTRSPTSHVSAVWAVALTAAAVGVGARLLLPSWGPLPTATVVLTTYAAVFGIGTYLARVPEARTLASRIRRA